MDGVQRGLVLRLDGHLLSSILIIITLCGRRSERPRLEVRWTLAVFYVIIITLCGRRSERPHLEVRWTLAVFYADNYNTMWPAFREASS